LGGGRTALAAVRETVLALRRRKAMLADPDEPEARSVGSFFENPILDAAGLAALEARWGGMAHEKPAPLPVYKTSEGFKVPAAWLIEQAGFRRGLRRGGVGISSRHALALVNLNGTARELLALAEEIRAGVRARFGVQLELEPAVVPA
jgi:UDP-N-acetylmuramate dehydrogenase